MPQGVALTSPQSPDVAQVFHCGNVSHFLSPQHDRLGQPGADAGDQVQGGRIDLVDRQGAMEEGKRTDRLLLPRKIPCRLFRDVWPMKGLRLAGESKTQQGKQTEDQGAQIPGGLVVAWDGQNIVLRVLHHIGHDQVSMKKYLVLIQQNHI